MNRSGSLAIIIIIVVVVLIVFGGILYFVTYSHPPISSTQAPFQWPSTYSVDVKTTSVDPKTNQTSVDAWFQYSVDGLKAKDADLENTSTVTIFRLDQGKVYSVNIPAEVYDVSPVPSSTIDVTPPFDPSGTWTLQGDEMVSGEPTAKYLVTASGSFYIWLNAETMDPVQAQFPSGVTEDFSNYSTAPIPDSEFEIPVGYTNFTDIPTTS